MNAPKEVFHSNLATEILTNDSLDLNTKGNFVMNVARNAAFQAMRLIHSELQEEIALENQTNTLDAYSERIVEEELGIDSDLVHMEQGFEHKATIAEWCALADAAVDQLAAVYVEMKNKARMDKKSSSDFLTADDLARLAYFDVPLGKLLDDQYERAWGIDPDKYQFSDLMLQRIKAEEAEADRGVVRTDLEIIADLKQRKLEFAQRVHGFKDEVLTRIKERAQAARRVECQSFETLFALVYGREQAARALAQLRSSIQNSLAGFAAAVRRNYEQHKSGAVNPKTGKPYTLWAASWIVLQKRGKQHDLDVLTNILLDRYAGTDAADGVKRSTPAPAQPVTEPGPTPAGMAPPQPVDAATANAIVQAFMAALAKQAAPVKN